MTHPVDAAFRTPPRADVMVALRDASQATGVDFGYLLKTAQRESSLDPTARATTSSAAGLFQFTDETWLATIARHGAKHGVDASHMPRAEILRLRDNPDISARMGAELAIENGRALQQGLGRPATPGELYVAHFLGPQDAQRLIRAAETGSSKPAAEFLPRAAAANRNVFHDRNGEALTAAQVYQNLTQTASAAAPTLPAQPVDRAGADASVLLQARMGSAALASTLMAALFGLQADER